MEALLHNEQNVVKGFNVPESVMRILYWPNSKYNKFLADWAKARIEVVKRYCLLVSLYIFCHCLIDLFRANVLQIRGKQADVSKTLTEIANVLHEIQKDIHQ